MAAGGSVKLARVISALNTRAADIWGNATSQLLLSGMNQEGNLRARGILPGKVEDLLNVLPELLRQVLV